ncbi:ParB N-terminal domain-containing protein [Corynebacterium diphtheriae]
MTSTMNIGRHAQYPLTDLNRFHKNARRGDVEAIMGSIVANGVYRPIYVNKGTYTGRPLEVLAGNHTLEAMRRLAEQNPEDPRWQTVDVWEVDVDDQRAAKIVLADNRTAELGDYDHDALVALLETVDDDLDGTGYDYDDLLEETSLTSEYISEDEPEAENEKRTTLAERFGIPPFTIFDTRQSPWIQRKNAWAPICENSAKGRENNLIYKSPQKRYSNWYSIKKTSG